MGSFFVILTRGRVRKWYHLSMFFVISVTSSGLGNYSDVSFSLRALPGHVRGTPVLHTIFMLDCRYVS